MNDSDKSTLNDNVLIGRNHWDVSVRVELRAYLNFGRRIDMQLRRLVARWSPTVSPHFRQTPASIRPTSNPTERR
jgi:hypothetical protein